MMSDIEKKLRKDINALEKMLDVAIEKFEEVEDRLIVYVSKDKIGRAIGPNGAVVRASELALNRSIEVRPFVG